MYYISNLDKPAMAAVSQLSSQGFVRKPTFPIALAYVLARTLNMPVEPIDGVEQYYRLTHDLTVKDGISKINELLPHDTKRTAELAKCFYLQRANALHPPEYTTAFRDMMGIRDFFGLSRAFSDETLDLIKTHSAELSVAVQLLTRICDNFKKVEEDVA